MTIAGIVAEYNPFHLGHQHQIRETRRILGPDCGIVCVMSGDFVQRGEAAVFSKFARAEAAVRSGADLVLELPLPWCIASAERFARGAVQILGGLGVVNVLSFGSECGDAAPLTALAKCLNGTAYSAGLRQFLNQGMSFAECRQRAVEGILGAAHAKMLTRPNDNLAVEYLRAIDSDGYAMRPLAVRRIGAGHDEQTEESVRSGSDLRNMLYLREKIDAYLPEAANKVFQNEIRQGRGPVTMAAMEPLLLSRLRMLDLLAFSDVPDAVEGLEHKLFSACQTQSSLSEIYDSVKSKRYTHARIRRMTLSAALGIQKTHFFERPPYARILAFNAVGSEILKAAKQTTCIPILNKPASVKSLEPSACKVFALTAKAHDLYVLAYENAGFHAGGQDWTTTPCRIC